jgi:hypothetical protein
MGQGRANASTRIGMLVSLLSLQLLLFPVVAQGRAASQDQERQPLGSLSSVGQVYVNNSSAPAESTIFTGDALRTEEAGVATFSTSGKGSLKITSHSQVVFAGTPQYVAELKSGIVVMGSLSGATGVSLRAGNFVVVAVAEGEQSTSKIESAADGSFSVTCLQGSVGVLPIEGANGLFLQAGQTLTISPHGELSAVKEAPAPATTPTPGTAAKKNNHAGWIALAVVGGGGVGVAAALAGHSSSGQSISP